MSWKWWMPVVVTSAILASPLTADSRPNVVMILADDQAYNDFGFMGNKLVQTPHIDRLAEQSARYVNGYVPSSVCRPSLATLLTGLYPHEHGIHFNHPPPGNSRLNKMANGDYDAARAKAERLFARNRRLPEILARHGYDSLQTGKFWEGHWRNGGFTEGMTTGRAAGVPGCWDKTLPDGVTVAHGNGDIGLIIGRVTMEPIVKFLDGHIQPATHEELCSSVDIVPTILSAVDLAQEAKGMSGIDLMPSARGETPLAPNRPVFGEVYPGDAGRLGDPAADIAYRWVRRGPWKLIVPHSSDGKPAWGGYLEEAALYNVVDDPEEQNNVILTSENAGVVAEFRDLLDGWWPMPAR